jgi:hypothetical protein
MANQLANCFYEHTGYVQLDLWSQGNEENRHRSSNSSSSDNSSDYSHDAS